MTLMEIVKHQAATEPDIFKELVETKTRAQ